MTNMSGGMNHTLKIACALLAAAVSVPARADDETELRLSNCRGDVVAYKQVSSSITTSAAALYYPASTMQAYAGCSITSIKVGTISSTSTGGVRVFITKDLDGTPEYEQECTAGNSGWNTFDLDSAYYITGDAIYIGYEVDGLKYIGLCNVFIEGEEWTATTSNGWKKYTESYSNAIEAIVTGDNLPKHNIYLNDITLPGYTTTGSPITCEGTFINLGASPVESLTLTYIADSVAVLCETVEVSSTDYRSTGTFTASGLSFGEECSADVYVVVSEVNGNPDVDTTDNVSRSKEILCRDSFTQRKILFEVFSTEKCTNCASAHRLIERTYEGYEGLVQVGHHSGYYTDGYTIDASTEYEWFYGTMVYAPAVMLDRTVFDNCTDNYSYEGTPVTSPSGDNLVALYDEAIAVPAFVTVNISKDYDEDTRHLTLTIDGEQLLPVDEYDDLRLNVYILEDSIFTTTQRNSDSYFFHRYSIRECLSDTWGDTVSIAGGYTASYETDIADTIDINQVYAVAFIANYDASDATNCNVLNTEEVKIIEAVTDVEDNEPTGITSLRSSDAASSMRVSRDCITTSGDGKVTVYDMSGRCLISSSVSGSQSIPLTQLPSGTYIVKSTANGGDTVKIVR